MISKVSVRYFKQFTKEEFRLSDHVVLAGPNNSGKTSLLQAIVVWDLAFRRWREKRGPETGSTAKQRTGVPLARKDFTALPLREMDLLWTDTQTALKKKDLVADEKAGQPRILRINLEGKTDGEPWALGFEFTRQSAEQVYIRPFPEHIDSIPDKATDISVVHVPPFSGIGSEETRYDRPYQDLLVGQAKAGDILRNLLYEVYQQSEGSWNLLCDQIREIFSYELLPPKYEGTPFILCEYLRGIPDGNKKHGFARLDVASAGSGFHQVLLLLGFLYARKSTVLLLDEPDAHLHIILQKQVYDMLRRIASHRRSQLIIATHAEVLIDNTSPHQILSFYQKPHILAANIDRQQVREALKRLTATDILQAETSRGIVYVEGEDDFDLLKAWAKVLQHPIESWFLRTPLWHANRGRHPQEAKGHFFAMKAIRPDLKGLLLLDGDNRSLPDREGSAESLAIVRWRRYEIESYLIHPTALLRFIEARTSELFAEPARAFLEDELPPAVYRNPLSEHDFLVGTAVSKSLMPKLFSTVQLDLPKSEYYLVAEQMRPGEIHDEVREKLDQIAAVVGVAHREQEHSK